MIQHACPAYRQSNFTTNCVESSLLGSTPKSCARMARTGHSNDRVSTTRSSVQLHRPAENASSACVHLLTLIRCECEKNMYLNVTGHQAASRRGACNDCNPACMEKKMDARVPLGEPGHPPQPPTPSPQARQPHVNHPAVYHVTRRPFRAGAGTEALSR